MTDAPHHLSFARAKLVFEHEQATVRLRRAQAASVDASDELELAKQARDAAQTAMDVASPQPVLPPAHLLADREAAFTALRAAHAAVAAALLALRPYPDGSRSFIRRP